MNIPTKLVQGRLWSSAPAQWARYHEPSFIPMYAYVLEQIPLNEEHMLLDAGCGAGLFLSMASATGAEVHGVDAAPGMLAIARGRAMAAALLPEDLEALPFIDGTFDVVTGFNAFEYAGTFENAIAEARRVVKRHGIVVIGMPDVVQCPSASILKAITDLNAPGAKTYTVDHAMSRESGQDAFYIAAGLRLRSTQTISCPLSFNSNHELLEGFLCMAPCAAAIEKVGEEAVRNCILHQAQPYNIADEMYYLKNHATVFITEKI
ncbi:class I SAM-dependent methyltransferase [Segetibacter sp. 3557_3]|uniref:class I SAM-dependent methyltransferase n=1 Tax=Segetibacter sp. 3557_3 TaxID=2547429 RepID=UPI0010587EC6|nr:class I SAM-dependent methyltransferase [Segetibacter sp. 3557_3]TDH24661.1 class I SAM-dependent methyltransferase [Segetibacter sp. 3557_3]